MCFLDQEWISHHSCFCRKVLCGLQWFQRGLKLFSKSARFACQEFMSNKTICCCLGVQLQDFQATTSDQGPLLETFHGLEVSDDDNYIKCQANFEGIVTNPIAKFPCQLFIAQRNEGTLREIFVVDITVLINDTLSECFSHVYHYGDCN